MCSQLRLGKYAQKHFSRKNFFAKVTSFKVTLRACLTLYHLQVLVDLERVKQLKLHKNFGMNHHYAQIISLVSK